MKTIKKIGVFAFALTIAFAIVACGGGAGGNGDGGGIDDPPKTGGIEDSTGIWREKASDCDGTCRTDYWEARMRLTKNSGMGSCNYT
jgi:hypothetical protein